MLGKILFVIFLLITESCQAMVYRSVITLIFLEPARTKHWKKQTYELKDSFSNSVHNIILLFIIWNGRANNTSHVIQLDEQ